MSPLKKGLIVLLVVVALLQAGLGGFKDMFGVSILGVSAQHGWHDAIILLLLAILVAMTLK